MSGKQNFLNIYTGVSIALVATLCISAYLNVMAIKWAVLGLCVLFIKRPDVLFPVTYISSLSGNIFLLVSGVSISRYLSIIFVFSCIVHLYIKRSNNNGNNIFLASVIIIYTFMSIILGYHGGVSFFIIMLTNLLVFFLFQKVEDFDLNNIVDVLCVSSLMAIALLWMYASRDGLFFMSDRFDLDGEANSNNLGMMIEQVGALCAAYAFWGKNSLLRLLSIIGVFASLSLVLMTGSRSALIALLSAALLCLFLITRESTNHKYVSSIFIIIILLSIGYIFVSFVSGIDNPVLDRFSVADVRETGGAGRSSNIKKLLTQIFPDHPLFGSGMGTANMDALGKSYGLSNAAHNIIIDPLTQMGIIGFSIYLFLIIPVLKDLVKLIKSKKSTCIIIAALLVAAVFNGIGEIIFYEKFFWCDMALVALASRQLAKGNV